MNKADWEKINDPAFINGIIPSDKGGSRLHDGSKVIRRFNLRGAQLAQGVKPGTVTISEDEKRMEVTWKDLKDSPTHWKRATGDGHFGWLHFVAPIRGKYYTWWIEKLRHPVETRGTGGADQLYAPAWTYNDGKQYPDIWAVFFDGKRESPVKDRDGENPYRPEPGSLCGVWVGGWKPGGANARTDIFPVRYKGSGEIEPPEPPVEPPDGRYEMGYNDAVIDMQAALEDLKK